MTSRGIFEAVPEPAGTPSPSPFAAVPESSSTPSPSPFAAVPESSSTPSPSPFAAVPEPAGAGKPSPLGAVAEASTIPAPQPQTARPSPFTVVEETEERQVASQRAVKIPEKRRPDSPFQVAEPSEGFGLMPATQGFQGFSASPFQAAYPTPASPFTPASAEIGMFGAPAYAAAPSFAPAPAYSAAAYFPPQAQHASPYQSANPFAQCSFAVPAAAAMDFGGQAAPASSGIRQIELRAIFGVDHEMGVDEILQRCRALPGIRKVAVMGATELGAIEALQHTLGQLGFGGGTLRVHAGDSPVEIIREGQAALAVQSDGSFVPGVRETLMIVAREMAKLV